MVGILIALICLVLKKLVSNTINVLEFSSGLLQRSPVICVYIYIHIYYIYMCYLKIAKLWKQFIISEPSVGLTHQIHIKLGRLWQTSPFSQRRPEAQNLTKLEAAGHGCPGEAEMMSHAGSRQAVQAAWLVWLGQGQGQEHFSQYSQAKLKSHLPLFCRPKFGFFVCSLYALMESHTVWSKQPFRNCNEILCLT